METPLEMDLSDEAVSARYGNRLRRAREDAGLTQREAAEGLGVSHTVVGRAEQGEASEQVLVRLERLYGLRETLPMAPKHPLRRREWIEARNAGLQNRKVPDAA